MGKKIFFGIFIFISVFFGAIFAILTFFKKFKLKGKDLNDEEEVSFKDEFEDRYDGYEEKNIVRENSSEWENVKF